VKIWTAHEKPHASPVLVHEGFSFGALIFGALWLAVQQAWWPAGGVFLLNILILLLTHRPASLVFILGLRLLLGFSGRDLVRWSIARRGYLESNVVTGRDEDEARSRLFAARPDLLDRSMVAEAPP
jgi:hypothetical protein